jgi:TatD DNase family protein
MLTDSHALTDSHVHLDLDEFAADLPAVLAHSRAVGVMRWIVPAIASRHWDRLAALQAAQPGVFYALGLHPWFLADESPQALEVLARRLEARPEGLVAVGECGLDGAIEGSLAQQLPWFERQIQLACELNLPLIVHCRRCYNEVLALLSRYRPPAGGVLHGFAGSRQQAEQFWALGFRLGVGGVITYERAQKTRRAVAQLPVQALLLETDAPSMPLSGAQGMRNEPWRVTEVLTVLAQLRQQPVEELIPQLESNVESLFFRPR